MDMSIDPSLVDKTIEANPFVAEEMGTQDDQAIKRAKSASTIEKAEGTRDKQLAAQIPFPQTTMISEDAIRDLQNIAALTGSGQGSALDSYIAMRFLEIGASVAASWSKSARENLDQTLDRNEQNLALKREMDRKLEQIRLGMQKQGEANPEKISEAQQSALIALGIVATMAMPGSQVVANNAVGSVVTSSGIVQSIIPTAMDPAVSVLVAFFGGTAVTKAALYSMKKAGQGEAKINQEFVDKHSKQTISNVNNPKLTQALQNILSTPKADGTVLSEKEINEKIAMVKLTMLLNALALGYKAEAGAVTPEEIGALLMGDMQFPEGDARNLLVGQILYFLPQLSKEIRQEFLLKFFNYLEDEKPSVDGLREPVRALHSMFSSPAARPASAA